MKKYILRQQNGDFLHMDCGYLVTWFNINIDAICSFDTREEAENFIKKYECAADVISATDI